MQKAVADHIGGAFRVGLVRCVAVCMIWFGLAASVQAKEPPLKWGADSEGGAPYIFKDPKNPEQNVGFEVELAAALARETGREIEFKHYNFKELIDGLKRGDIDFVMNGLEVTPDRRKMPIRFSRPYYIYTEQLVVRADEKRFQSFEDCKALNAASQKLTIGTLENTAAQRLLEEAKFGVKPYEGQFEPYVDLSLGRTDGVVMDTPISLYCVKFNPELNSKLKFAGPGFSQGYYAIAFRQNDEQLATLFDDAIGRLHASGELRRIYEKWNLWNDDQDRLAVAKVSDVAAESAKLWTPAVYFPFLLEGAWMTIKLSVLSMALAVVLGMFVAVVRLYGPLPLRWLAITYVEFFRGIPVLLLLFFMYFGLPEITSGWAIGKWFQLGPVVAAVLSFGLNYAAFEAEIYRSGIDSIPAGQWEAAASLGMSSSQTFWRIIFPQAIRTILPPSTNDFVALFKDTSVVSIVSVIELTKQYQILSKSSMKYLEIGLATALLYLIMSVPLGMLSRYLERYWNRELHT